MDNEIQDKYMDAVLAMLMDEYAEAEAEMLLQNSKDEIPEVEMPEELDRKCQALIRKKFVRKKRQHALEALGRASKWAAVLAIILLGTFSALFLTVDAVRTPVINLYLKNMGNHSVLTIGQPSQQSMQESLGDGFTDILVSKLAELLPAGYTLEEGYFDENGVGFACFTNREKSDINLNIMNGNSFYAVDTENCDICERLSGEGIEGYYIEKGDRKSVVWLNNSEGKIYTLASGALGKDSLLQIANTLQGLEDTNS